MIFKEKEFISTDGTKFLLRSPWPTDSAAMLEYLKTVAAETEFMLRYPEEVTMTVEEEEAFLARKMHAPGDLFLAVFQDGKIIGNASLGPISGIQKARHRAVFGIAVIKEFWHKGLGRELMSNLISFARDYGYEQVELEAASCNTKAVNLYKKMGFEIYGERPNAFKLKDGSYYHEYLMVLKL